MALFISGVNRSDDLFMFYKGQVGGLQGGTTYQVSFQVEFATIAPSGCIGVGGAPGENVYIKAGATTERANGIEPRRHSAHERRQRPAEFGWR